MDVTITTDPAQIAAQSQHWSPLAGGGPQDFVADAGFTQHTINIPLSVFASLADELAKRLQQRTYAPAVLVPGGTGAAVTPDGSLLTVGADGEVYRDGAQLPGVAARQVVRFGISVYAQGKTVPDWYRWTGSSWARVTAVDARVLKDL